MYIHKVDIKNFRLLEEVDLFLEERTTVIVGRNNSGKTSLTELFRRLLSDNSPTFRLEDFSFSVHEKFWKAFILKCQGREEFEIRNALPIIEVKLTINYDKEASSLGPLGDFIIDLDPDCGQALIVVRYQLKDGEIDEFFEGIGFDQTTPEDPQQKTKFFRAIKERVPKRYDASVLAVDPNDPTNQKLMKWSELHALLQSGFINAQRGLDDTTDRERDVLGKILEALFHTAMSDSADPKDRDIAKKLESAVKDVQEGIHEGFNKQLKDLLPAFSLFGYPGLSDPRLETETTLDVQRLLKNYTKVHYAGVNGINLPEAYNGLGTRNLIFILLKLLEFFKSFLAKEASPGIHLIFIEEPEVHLHPQMQEVFINKLNEIALAFAKKFNNGIQWPVQFVVTTHSSHLANRVPFESMRYFIAPTVEHTGSIFRARIKDLRNGLGGTPKEDQEFLHKYMTLTRCDLLFADKAVLIEGSTERLLLPRMIEKVDKYQPDGLKLSSQYVSVVEVGGAYAHRFFRLLDFLELRTLIITDLDTAQKSDKNRLIACEVSKGTHTSNGCIKNWFDGTIAKYQVEKLGLDWNDVFEKLTRNDWAVKISPTAVRLTVDLNVEKAVKSKVFGENFSKILSILQQDITPTDLIQKSDEGKIHGIRRLAYQVPESESTPCGRSFEEAFILANPDLFALTNVPESEREEKAQEIVAENVRKKSDFALEYAIYKTEWAVPRYIAEGIRWLAEGIRGQVVTSSPSTAESAVASVTHSHQE